LSEPAFAHLPACVVGIGVDVVDTARFAAVIGRRPTIIDRLFTPHECVDAHGLRRQPHSLAARFAAKEAVVKVLKDTTGMQWHDCQVLVDANGAPNLRMRGRVAEAAEWLGITAWHVSLTHDGAHAMAFVVAEGVGP